jgi:hypothetical protein
LHKQAETAYPVLLIRLSDEHISKQVCVYLSKTVGAHQEGIFSKPTALHAPRGQQGALEDCGTTSHIIYMPVVLQSTESSYSLTQAQAQTK